MRTTLMIDDDLMREAQSYLGTRQKTAVVREALRALIQREAARALAAAGGSDPDATAGRRSRLAPPSNDSG